MRSSSERIFLIKMDQTKSKARQIKTETINTLGEKISKAKVLAFADYHGLGANQINSLRQKVKEANGELIIAKNTLLARALILTNYQLPATNYQLTGPTVAILAYQDEIAPVKAIAEFIKTLGLPKFKFAFFGKDFLDAVALEALSKIPDRNILQAKVVGAIASPLYGLVYVLQANLRNLISVLDQKAKSGSS